MLLAGGERIVGKGDSEGDSETLGKDNSFDTFPGTPGPFNASHLITFETIAPGNCPLVGALAISPREFWGVVE